MIVDILASGSTGNAVFLNNEILIDVGVSFSKIKPILKEIKAVLLTHRHGDHFNKSTIKKISEERPLVYFVCGEWLALEVCKLVGVEKVLILTEGKIVYFSKFSLKLQEVTHNVPNCCYHIFYKDEKCFYCTDMNDLKGISAKNYDLYLIEANYIESEIKKRIKQKMLNGEFCHELGSIKNHMSKEKIDDWLCENAGNKSKYIYLHISEVDKEKILKG